MTKFGIRSLQMTLGAIALSVAGLASAQTPAEAPAPAAATTAPAKHMHKKGHKHHHHHQHGKKHGHRDVASGSSSSREAAAARQEERAGRLGNNQGENQYQRNALARCEVFKTELDKQACIGRMTNGQVSGAVQEGGALREYVQQVPAR